MIIVTTSGNRRLRRKLRAREAALMQTARRAIANEALERMVAGLGTRGRDLPALLRSRVRLERIADARSLPTDTEPSGVASACGGNGIEWAPSFGSGGGGGGYNIGGNGGSYGGGGGGGFPGANGADGLLAITYTPSGTSPMAARRLPAKAKSSLRR